MLQEVLTPIVSAIVAAIVAPITVEVLSHRIDAKADAREVELQEGRREAEEAEEARIAHDRLMDEAMQAMLRNNIIMFYVQYEAEERIPLHVKSALERTYRSYHELGGDDVATSLYLQLMDKPICPSDYVIRATAVAHDDPRLKLGVEDGSRKV